MLFTLNGYRRHLTIDEQKEIKLRAAYKIAEQTKDRKHGGERGNQYESAKAPAALCQGIKDLAKEAGISDNTVRNVKLIKTDLEHRVESNPNDVEAIRDLKLLELGKLDVSYRSDKIKQEKNLQKLLS